MISEVMPNGYPKESGYVAAFVVSGAGLLVAALAACLIPTRAGRRWCSSSRIRP